MQSVKILTLSNTTWNPAIVLFTTHYWFMQLLEINGQNGGGVGISRGGPATT